MLAPMNWRKFFFESLSLLISAVLCAFVANSVAGRERKLAIVGEYPNALTVPQRSPDGPQAFPQALAPSFPPAAGSQDPAPAASPAVTSQTAATPVPSVSAQAPVKEEPPPPRIIEKPLSEKDLLVRFPPSKDHPYREIPPQDVAFLHQTGVLFLDARRSNVYEEGHIEGARSMPVWESDISDRVLAFVNEGRNQELPVVIYCSGGDCEDSHMLAERLFGAGFSNLLIYREGFPDWMKRGGKAARGVPR